MDEKDLARKEVKSFKFAFEGLRHALESQINFRIQIIFAFLVVFLAFLLEFDRFEWLILLISICLVLSAELMNTVIEVLVDIASPKIHPKAKIAKDISASFVFLIALFVTIIGFFLFVPHFLSIF